MPKPIYAASDEELAQLGITEVVETWEDGFRTDTGRDFFEWWYFDAHLDDGSTAVIVFITKEIMERKGPLRPGLKMTITRPDGVKLSASPFFPPDEFTASKQSCDVKIGPNWVHGDLHTYQLHAEANGMSADLTFTGIVPPWRPLDGKAYFGDREHYFGWLPAIPYGTVQGTLTYDGKTHNVTGSGYHDHNWGNLSLPNVIDHWYWGRAQFGDYTVIFVEQTTHRTYGSRKLPVFLLAKGKEILTGDGLPMKLKKTNFVKHAGGREYPTELDFHWELDDKQVHITLRQPEIIEATSLLEMLPTWKRKLLGLFVNPYYFRFNAEMELKIDFGDIQAHEQGPVLYELMMLG